MQPDGRIVLGGFFNQYNGTPDRGVVRVNTDGSVDTSFAPGDGVGRGNFAQALALQGDGKIIVGGNFARFNGVAEGGIVRLNADGSIDPTFNAGVGASGRSDVVYGVAVQGDGKVVVGGDFTTFNAAPTDGIVRLNADGTVDPTFKHQRRRGPVVCLRRGAASGRRGAGGRNSPRWAASLRRGSRGSMPLAATRA